MFNSSRSFIIFVVCAAATGGSLIQNTDTKGVDFYRRILMEMESQQNYEGLLIVHRVKTQDPRLEAIFTFPIPKIIVTKQSGFSYKGLFGSEAAAVIVMEYEFCTDLWTEFTNTLNFMRHIRILVIFLDPLSTEHILRNLLIACKTTKITNIIVHFLNTSSLEEPSSEYLLLSPYPEHHLQPQQLEETEKYFLPEKLNMKGKAIITLPDQSLPRSFMYRNRNGELKLSGLAFKLLELFVQVYNGTYRLLYQPKFGEVIHISILSNMTKHGLLDMPMCVSPLHKSKNVLHSFSYPLEFSQWAIMVPCAKYMKVTEVYEVLFTVHTVFIFVIFLVLFSLIHTTIEKLFYKQTNWPNLLMSDKIIPGLLGQSFTLKKTKLISLRSIYVLIFVMGLFMSTTISAHLQTLLTRPPLKKQINTFQQLHASGLKILFPRLDLNYLEEDDYIYKEKLKPVVKYTNDTTMFIKYRTNFNSTYAYTVTSDVWNVFSYIQKAYIQKEFCTNADLNIMDILMLGVPLELNSPYAMPLNDLIHRIHDSGLFYIWQIQAIGDLLRLKKISFRDSSRMKTFEDLTENDLLYVWMILSFGLISSCFIFFVELIVYNMVEYLKNTF